MFDMAPMGPLWWTIGLVVFVLLGVACPGLPCASAAPRQRSVSPPIHVPVQLLRHHLANGEIDDEDYRRRRSALGD